MYHLIPSVWCVNRSKLVYQRQSHKNGGCFSIVLPNKQALKIWSTICFQSSALWNKWQNVTGTNDWKITFGYVIFVNFKFIQQKRFWSVLLLIWWPEPTFWLSLQGPRLRFAFCALFAGTLHVSSRRCRVCGATEPYNSPWDEPKRQKENPWAIPQVQPVLPTRNPSSMRPGTWHTGSAVERGLSYCLDITLRQEEIPLSHQICANDLFSISCDFQKQKRLHQGFKTRSTMILLTDQRISAKYKTAWQKGNIFVLGYSTLSCFPLICTTLFDVTCITWSQEWVLSLSTTTSDHCNWPVPQPSLQWQVSLNSSAVLGFSPRGAYMYPNEQCFSRRFFATTSLFSPTH